MVQVLIGVGGQVAGEEKPVSVLSLDASSFVQSEKSSDKHKSIVFTSLFKFVYVH